MRYPQRGDLIVPEHAIQVRLGKGRCAEHCPLMGQGGAPGVRSSVQRMQRGVMCAPERSCVKMLK